MIRVSSVIVLFSMQMLSSCWRERPLSISALIANASLYQGQIVSVEGCYSNGIEKVIIRDCLHPQPDQLISVIPYQQVEDSERAVPGFRARATSTEYPTPAEQKLYKSLVGMPNGITTEVVVRGEFQSSDDDLHGRDQSHKYQLILYRVLKSRK